MPNRFVKKQNKHIIARRIKEVRKEKGLSQFSLSLAIECNQALISQYENAAAEPPLGTLIAICDALGCSMDYIIGRDVEYNTETPRGQLLQAFEKLSTSEQLFFSSLLAMVVKNKK